MLKTLEEPPSFAHLVLLTDRPGEVLPTIASRCQHVRFDARPPAALAERLARHGIAGDQATACARLALGDGERALALALGTGPALRAGAEALARAILRDELRDRPWAALLAEAKRAGEQAASEAEGRTVAELEVAPRRERKRVEREGTERGRRAERRARTDALDLGLRLVGLWYRDLACVLDGAPEIVHHADRPDALRADAEGRDAGRLRAAVAPVDDARFRQRLNLTDELGLEALAYRLARELS
jgi:DNA polymerase-3 subunit delta'